MSSHLKIPLVDLLRKTTHRQFKLWILWLAEEWNSLDKKDNYLMQIACEIRRVLRKKPAEVKLEHFKLKFEKQNKVHQEEYIEDEETIAARLKDKANLSKSIWLGALGISPQESKGNK